MCKVEGVQKTINITPSLCAFVRVKVKPRGNIYKCTYIPIHTCMASHTTPIHVHICVQAPEAFWARTCWTSFNTPFAKCSWNLMFCEKWIYKWEMNENKLSHICKEEPICLHGSVLVCSICSWLPLFKHLWKEILWDLSNDELIVINAIKWIVIHTQLWLLWLTNSVSTYVTNDFYLSHTAYPLFAGKH